MITRNLRVIKAREIGMRNRYDANLLPTLRKVIRVHLAQSRITRINGKGETRQHRGLRFLHVSLGILITLIMLIIAGLGRRKFRVKSFGIEIDRRESFAIALELCPRGIRLR